MFRMAALQQPPSASRRRALVAREQTPDGGAGRFDHLQWIEGEQNASFHDHMPIDNHRVDVVGGGSENEQVGQSLAVGAHARAQMGLVEINEYDIGALAPL